VAFLPLTGRTPVPVDRLPAGLYFFRLWENGRPGAGGRLVIQR
jgi:hypothetical protein